MTRKEITSFLSKILISEKLLSMGYYASEVSIDYGTDNIKRIDFMQFKPVNTYSLSGIEKGTFICYEVKSCKEDVYSGNGLNFFGEQNYIVTTMECYKKIISDMNSEKLFQHIKKCCPDSSTNFGIMVAVPDGKVIIDEFNNPTPLDDKSVTNWKLYTIQYSIPGTRNKSITELLFCMLRSGR